MERRYETRLKEMLVQAQVPGDLVTGLLERLQAFAEPYAIALTEPEQRQHTVEYIRGCSPNSITRPARPSPICTTKSDRVSRSSSAMCPGITNHCSRHSHGKLRQTWANLMP